MKRNKTANELQMAIAELEDIYVKYVVCTGKEYCIKQKKHDLLKIRPLPLYGNYSMSGDLESIEFEKLIIKKSMRANVFSYL